MKRDPADRMATTYEWVVERLEGADDDDIADCSYWDEPQLAQALQLRDLWRAEGHRVDFGLCWHLGNEIDGEIDRAYAYTDAAGHLPALMENGRRVPQRILAALAKAAQP